MQSIIAGISGPPLDHADVIVGVVRQRGLPMQAATIALMTGITESNIRILANTGDPSSIALPHDGVGADHDSAGIFQQRPPWGPIAVRMDPAGSAGLFLDRLVGFGWQSLEPWAAAQQVQVSAYDGSPRAANNFNAEYGGNYHGNYAQADTLANALWIAADIAEPVPQEDDVAFKDFLLLDGGHNYWVVAHDLSSRTQVTPKVAANLQRTGEYQSTGWDQTSLNKIPIAK